MSQDSSSVRVRFAPSPTGYLHVGGARTALYNYLFAKSQGGKFILRIEDTDQARSTDESLKMVLHDLKWLGLNWDEGPHPETLQDMGPHGPYKQSQRISVYKEVAEKMLKEGKAYYCFLTDAEIEQQKEQALKAGAHHAHIQSPYEGWTLEQALQKKSEGATAVVRFKTRDLAKDYTFKDIVRGEITFPSDMVGDFVLLRSDGMPVYNFCCVVDDYLMKISHVLRAEEHLPNTLRQMMIYEAMNWQMPQFGHLSVVLDEDRQKMSKRRGATSCFQFKEEGYLPEAIKNFVLLLGWSHPDGLELMDQSEMIRAFSLDRFNASGAVFDRVKLKWMNSVYLRALPDEELWKNIQPHLQSHQITTPQNPEWVHSALAAFRNYLEVFADAVPLFRHVDDQYFAVQSEAQEALGWDTTPAVLNAWQKGLSQKDDNHLMTEAEFLALQDQVKAESGTKGKNLFMPVRVAVIGVPHGTELKLLVPLISVRSLKSRVEKVLAQIG